MDNSNRSTLIAIILFLLFALISGRSAALDFEEESFGDMIGYGLDATLDGEELLISSYDRLHGSLVFSQKVGGNWTTTEVVSNVVNIIYPEEAETSIVLDSQNEPNIFYYNSYSSDLLIAHRSDGVWSTETIDSDGQTGGFPEAINCGGGELCVCYKDISNGNLKFARGAPGSWTVTTVDNSANNVGAHCDLVKSGEGDIFVAYYDATQQFAKVAQLHDGVWSLTTLNSGAHFGKWNSMAIDSDGSIAFISSCPKESDTGESDCGLFWATRQSNGSWTAGQQDNTEAGGHPSLAYDQLGRARMTYRYQLFSALFGRYTRMLFYSYSNDPFARYSTIDGSNFCLGTFLYSRTLITPLGFIYSVYFRSYGACGGNVSEIAVKKAPSPALEPDPTPTPEPSASPTPEDPGQATPTPDPDDDGDDNNGGGGGGGGNFPTAIDLDATFNKGTGAYECSISADQELSDACQLNLDFSTSSTFSTKSSFTVPIQDPDVLSVTGQNKKKIFILNKKSLSIYSRARYTCSGHNDLTSSSFNFKPKVIKVKAGSQSPAKWLTGLIRTLVVE